MTATAYDRVVGAFPAAPEAVPKLARIQERLRDRHLWIKEHANQAIVEQLIEASMAGFRLTDAGVRYLVSKGLRPA